MRRIVSNATPLIYLAKVNVLKLLHDMFKITLIPEAVYREVVIKGKNKGERDAFRIDKAIMDGWIKIKKINKIYNAEIPIHYGEVEVISLAMEMGIKTVLMDDIKARTVAEMAGLNPRGTLWLLLKAVKKEVLDFDQFLAILENIVEAGFYLKENVFLKAIHRAKDLSGK